MLIVYGQILLLFTPESFGPVVLKRRAQKLRKETNEEVYAPIELESKGVRHVITVVLTRPLRMFFFEGELYTSLIIRRTSCSHLGQQSLSSLVSIYHLFTPSFTSSYRHIRLSLKVSH